MILEGMLAFVKLFSRENDLNFFSFKNNSISFSNTLSYLRKIMYLLNPVIINISKQHKSEQQLQSENGTSPCPGAPPGRAAAGRPPARTGERRGPGSRAPTRQAWSACTLKTE